MPDTLSVPCLVTLCSFFTFHSCCLREISTTLVSSTQSSNSFRLPWWCHGWCWCKVGRTLFQPWKVPFLFKRPKKQHFEFFQMLNINFKHFGKLLPPILLFSIYSYNNSLKIANNIESCLLFVKTFKSLKGLRENVTHVTNRSLTILLCTLKVAIYSTYLLTYHCWTIHSYKLNLKSTLLAMWRPRHIDPFHGLEQACTTYGPWKLLIRPAKTLIVFILLLSLIKKHPLNVLKHINFGPRI